MDRGTYSISAVANYPVCIRLGNLVQSPSLPHYKPHAYNVLRCELVLSSQQSQTSVSQNTPTLLLPMGSGTDSRSPTNRTCYVAGRKPKNYLVP